MNILQYMKRDESKNMYRSRENERYEDENVKKKTERERWITERDTDTLSELLLYVTRLCSLHTRQFERPQIPSSVVV
jgi:hypothetical protein